MSLEIKKPCSAKIEDGQLQVVRPDDSRESRTFQGLYRSLANNMVVGVSEGFEKRLEVVGVGYKAEVLPNVLRMSLGYAFPKDFPIPEGIEISLEKEQIVIRGIDKVLVGNVAAKIRSLRPPEPYKGKGIRYQGEQVRRKAGKAAASGGK